jgi:hypothetical protein
MLNDPADREGHLEIQRFMAHETRCSRMQQFWAS